MNKKKHGIEGKPGEYFSGIRMLYRASVAKIYRNLKRDYTRGLVSLKMVEHILRVTKPN